ncbi:ARM repeat-containing protein [Heliocybe sulcata]|uniref:Importin-95 n=1 Tax=Heliocybe sulcata TaxID=5364 RepID=A0A5C3MTN1_9AGAM|nr:ARM repeat-containing protein [Heliocybe sulcata]
MNAGELLSNTLSPDATTRQDAESKLEAAARENFPAYMLMLSSELINEGAEPHVRNAAGLALKNAVSAREVARQADYATRWLSLDNDTRNKIKQDSLMSLGQQNLRVAHVGAQVVSAIACVEIPAGQWQDLITLLLGFVNDANNTNLRISTLETIGFICEGIKSEVLSLRSNEILTAVIHGARKEEPSPDCQYAAIHALFNALDFVRDNFEREGERNYIMQVICEATQNPNVKVQIGAYECLVRVMSLYYDKMSFYMERALFGLTVLGMKNPEEAVALQAIEFWSTVCEEEYELQLEANEAAEYGEFPEIESHNFSKIALPEIVPVLLTLLTRQEEEADEDEWNVAMAAATCLGLLAKAVQDTIVSAVIPFIEAHIKSQDWHQREAAVMTFGSIMDGPDPQVLAPLVHQALPLLIDMMTDPVVQVRDTVAWTLGRICDLLISTLKVDVHVHPLVSALVNGLSDNPRIISNCCWALTNLADGLSELTEEGTAPPTGSLSPYYEGVIQALLKVTETASNESNFRTAAYEAIAAFCVNAPGDVVPVVQNTIVTILVRMEHLIGVANQILGIDDRNNWNDLQTNLCSVIVSVIRRLGDGVQPLADRIMTLILQLIECAAKSSTVMEDAFLVVGTLSTALEQGFAAYMGAFLPYLHPALKAHEDTQLCTVAVGLIGDFSRALGELSAQYSDAFMRVLLENLQSEVLNRNVKISILSCFGDIALAIGAAFEPYLETTMSVLRQAGSVQPNPLDYELVEYVSNLREGILEAYTGVVTGLKNTDKVSLLVPYVPSILELCQRCLNDDERPDSVAKLSYGLIGDLADSFPGGEIKQLLLAEWIGHELRSRSRMAGETKRTLRWAREMVKRATA